MTRLDPDLDPSTVLPGDFSFAGTEVAFDPVSGTLTWLLPEINLPPNTQPPNGEGFVSFSASPKPNLPTGTVISESAQVFFDFNPPVATPTVIRTIDSTPPTSQALPLPAIETSTSFQVQWSGTDQGSGIASYDVYVSDDSGPFTPFLLGTTDTSATFAGQRGHTYAFYSVAIDNVGNRQPTPTAAQASTWTGNPLAITPPPALPPAKVGVAYRQAITVSGGSGPDHFSVTSGSLPPGVTLNASTGLLSGTPTRAGTYHFTIHVADSSPAPGSSASRSFTLTVAQGDVARLVFLSQPGHAPVNAFLLPFQVLVQDRYGNPLCGVVVRMTLVRIVSPWAPAFSPGSVVQATAVNGVATFSRVAIGKRGRYNLRAYAGLVDMLSNPFDVGSVGGRMT
jgi:hypothetical protein